MLLPILSCLRLVTNLWPSTDQRTRPRASFSTGLDSLDSGRGNQSKWLRGIVLWMLAAAFMISWSGSSPVVFQNFSVLKEMLDCPLTISTCSPHATGFWVRLGTHGWGHVSGHPNSEKPTRAKSKAKRRSWFPRESRKSHLFTRSGVETNPHVHTDYSYNMLDIVLSAVNGKPLKPHTVDSYPCKSGAPWEAFDHIEKQSVRPKPSR